MSIFRSKFPAGVLVSWLAVLPLAAQNARSGSAEIRLGLERVRTLGSALMIAAHPDDENTAVLAWLAGGRHMRTAYLSLTRGEGGQNLIGSEQGDALGVIRTQELLAARRIDGAEQFFTRAIDFGFSKSPQEAITKWGHDEILSDIVWVIRSFRPDVIILRFSGTPRDGHGHHQASAILGKEAFEAAGDPKRFPEQLKFVKPWRARRLMWNAFSFSREQEKEAQASPVKVDVGVYNPIIGLSYGEIAGLSRSQHRSQAMGVPERRGSVRDFFSNVAGEPANDDLFEGVSTSWDRFEGGSEVASLLARAEEEFEPAEPQKLIPILVQARAAMAKLEPQDPDRIRAKQTELNRIIADCAGLWIDAAADRYQVAPGAEFAVTATVVNRLGGPAQWTSVDLAGCERAAEKVGETLKNNEPASRTVKVKLPADLPYSQPFWLKDPNQGFRYSITDQHFVGRAAPFPAMTATFQLEVQGTPLTIELPVQHRYVDRERGELLRPLEVVPPVAVNLAQPVTVFANGQARKVIVQLSSTGTPVQGELRLEVPAGWSTSKPVAFQLDGEAGQEEIGFAVTPPQNAGSTRAEFRAVARVNGNDVSTGVQNIQYEHIPPQMIFRPAEGALQPVDVRVLSRNIGYVMGAGDMVPDAIRQMGCSVTYLGPSDLLGRDLSAYDAIVTGVRAYNVRPDLRAAQPRLMEYVKNGGTLVVQYNVLEFGRGGRAPDLGPLGPYPFELSRDRIVEEDSPVRFTDPESDLVKKPNVIGPKDFDGWIQERGLYFPAKWDPRYQTVFTTHDKGEKDLAGGTLFTRYGKGAYVFTGYSWFRELPAGVPGAYRIFANLLSAGKVQAETPASAPRQESSGSAGH